MTNTQDVNWSIAERPLFTPLNKSQQCKQGAQRAPQGGVAGQFQEFLIVILSGINNRRPNIII